MAKVSDRTVKLGHKYQHPKMSQRVEESVGAPIKPFLRSEFIRKAHSSLMQAIKGYSTEDGRLGKDPVIKIWFTDKWTYLELEMVLIDGMKGLEWASTYNWSGLTTNLFAGLEQAIRVVEAQQWERRITIDASGVMVTEASR